MGVIVAANLCAVSLGAINAAHADVDFDPLPDGGAHTYCFGETHAPNNIVAERIHWSEGTLENQTAVTTDFHGAGCTDQSDVRWQQRSIDGYADGWADCLNYNDNGRCDQFRVRIDYGLIQDYADSPPAEVRHATCHELGHTASASHYGQGIANPDAPGHSCMRSGLWDGGEEWTKSYGRHHINFHFNRHF
ncbi:hypothetical protein [Nocardioides stalactiti]|uniref:hypothetical protein n=1 Tax=Nocardioides stalactiti TaxID=2755356 RepID=UPI001604468E|nr:hypothetical protein [Nocardioides stalactiti]